MCSLAINGQNIPKELTQASSFGEVFDFDLYDICESIEEDSRIVIDMNTGFVYAQALVGKTVYTAVVTQLTFASGNGETVYADTIMADNGSKYYLYIYYHGKGFRRYEIMAYKIENWKLVPAAIFKTKKETLAAFSHDWNVDSFDGRYYDIINCPRGYEDYLIVNYDNESKTLNVPHIEKDEYGSLYASGKVLEYKFDGKQFVYQGIKSPLWRHVSLRDFKKADVLLYFNEHIVMIDEMPDGTYRYASWANYGFDSLFEKPDIVIGNGSYDDVDDYYSFTNGNYEYTVVSMDSEKWQLQVVYLPEQRIILVEESIL